MTIKTKILTVRDYNIKLAATKRKYENHPYQNAKTVLHLKKVLDTNELYCHICENSLEENIGKETVYSIRKHRTHYYHVDCARLKNII